MPKVEEIIGEGPEPAKCSADVLTLLEKHPGYLFQMQNDDIEGLLRWLTSPDADEPPGVSPEMAVAYSVETIEWALSTLYAGRKIGRYEYVGRTYYGSHKAIEKATQMGPMKGIGIHAKYS